MSDSPNNALRSWWAQKGLEAYAHENRHYEIDWTGDEVDEIIRDFFADLRHFADTVYIDQETLSDYFANSEEVYQEEVAEEKDEEANE